jgi:predicted ferric reductase
VLLPMVSARIHCNLADQLPSKTFRSRPDYAATRLLCSCQWSARAFTVILPIDGKFSGILFGAGRTKISLIKAHTNPGRDGVPADRSTNSLATQQYNPQNLNRLIRNQFSIKLVPVFSLLTKPNKMAGSPSDKDAGRIVHRLQSWSSSLFAVLAFLLALFPSVIKMYETSHWYREGDPSKYDEAKDWLSNTKLPYEGSFQSSKVLMRVYFFIIPYILSALALLMVALIPSRAPQATTKPRTMLIARSFLRRTFSFPNVLVKIGSPLRISVGELFGVCAFLVVNLGTLVVRVKRSYPRGSRKLSFLVDEGDAGKETIDTFSWQACEVWAKTLGVLAILNLGWYLLMPIGRRSVLLEAVNMPWERAVKYHRWVGFYTVGIMAIHGFMYFGVFAHGDGHPSYDPQGVMLKHNLVPWGCNEECDKDQRLRLRINMYGIVSLLLVLTMTGFALPWVRRHKFEWFYYMHHLALPLLVFVCLHYPGAFIYLIPGIAIYSVDKIMGLLAYRSCVQATTRLVSSDVLEVSVQLGNGVQYKAGQYVFLNVPNVSFLEWHPFSLTSAPGDGTNKIVFHLKEAGEWTRQVVHCATSAQNGRLRVRLDGFYGHESQLETYKDGAILVGGGIGVTPMMSLAMGLLRQTTTPVTLLWVVRTIDEFHLFSTELSQALQGAKERLVVKVWITLSRPEPLLLTSDEEQDTNPQVDKGAMKEMTANDQFLRVLQVLRQKKEQEVAQVVDENESYFYPCGLSNTPALNIFVMFLAMWMGLNSYALASWLVNEKRAKIEDPEDKSVVFDLVLLAAFLLLVICFAVAIRPFAKHFCLAGRGLDGKATDDSHDKLDPTDMRRGSSNSSSSNNSSTEKDSSSDSDDEELLQAMLEGHIGCRPNLSDEFGAVVKGADADIGVVACGPLPLIQQINGICNSSGGRISWGIQTDESDVNGAFFAFTEDDWEW